MNGYYIVCIGYYLLEIYWWLCIMIIEEEGRLYDIMRMFN